MSWKRFAISPSSCSPREYPFRWSFAFFRSGCLDDFCIIQFLAHPHQINWTNSLTFNHIYSKLKASARGTWFEMPKKLCFSQFRSDSMSQCNTACSNTACATPPVERRPWNTACSTHQTANKKQKLVSLNFLAASVKKHCFQDTNINKKTFCFYQISITLLYIIL